MKRSIEDGLSLLAGAGIGVGLMYLLDPDKGPQRRRRIAARTSDAAASAQDAATAAWAKISGQDQQHPWTERVGDASRSALAAIGAGLSRAGHATAEGAQHAAHSTKAGAAHLFGGHNVHDLAARRYNDLHNIISQRVEAASDAAVEQKDSLMERARAMMSNVHLPTINWRGRQPERQHHYVGQTVGALGALALGAGIVWMFDPRLGRSRRAWLRDKSVKLVRETGDMMNRSGRRVAHHLQGTVATTRSKFRKEPISDEKLVARVRSELGRTVTNMGDVQVTAADGHVTIVGQCEPRRAGELVAVIEKIPGVRGVDNQLSGMSQSQPAPTGL